jgi:hypothetical protein
VHENEDAAAGGRRAGVQTLRACGRRAHDEAAHFARHALGCVARRAARHDKLDASRRAACSGRFLRRAQRLGERVGLREAVRRGSQHAPRHARRGGTSLRAGITTDTLASVATGSRHAAAASAAARRVARAQSATRAGPPRIAGTVAWLHSTRARARRGGAQGFLPPREAANSLRASTAGEGEGARAQANAARGGVSLGVANDLVELAAALLGLLLRACRAHRYGRRHRARRHGLRARDLALGLLGGLDAEVGAAESEALRAEGRA